MKTARFVTLVCVCLAAISLLAIDFWKSDGRFYSGDPKPQAEVSLLVGEVGAVYSCPVFAKLMEPDKPPKTLLAGKTFLEVLPGHYEVQMGCMDSKFKWTEDKPPVMAVDAKPGHVYYFSLEDRKRRGGNVLITDIGKDEDYAFKGGDMVKKLVDKYFRGKRHEVQEHPLTTKGAMAWN